MLVESAAEQVWSLVSGLPPGQRERRRLMTLQAWIDDSGNEPTSPVFYLAGFMAPHEKWAEFSAEWQAELDRKPKLDYFKMTQAARLRGEFDERKGWTGELRDQRVMAFANIAKKYAEVRVSAHMRHDHFNRYMMAHPAVQRKLSTDNPYAVMFTQLILNVAVYSPELGINEPCDFIFDEQDGFFDDAVEMWPGFREQVRRSERPEVAELFGSKPIPRNDKQFLPLQAGDLYAWHLRSHWVKSRPTPKPLGPVLSLFEPMKKIEKIFTGGEMRRMNRFLLDERRKVAPGIKLVHAGKTRAERRALRKRPRPKS